MENLIKEKYLKAIEMRPTMSTSKSILMISNKEKQFVRLQIVGQESYFAGNGEKIIAEWKGLGLKEGPQAETERRIHPDALNAMISNLYKSLEEV